MKAERAFYVNLLIEIEKLTIEKEKRIIPKISKRLIIIYAKISHQIRQQTVSS